MNKRKTVWLIVRLIGVYFAYLTIVTFFSLIGATYAYISPSSANTTTNSNTMVTANRASMPTTRPQTPGVPTPKTDEERAVEKEAEKAKSIALKQVFWQLFLTAIYGAVGFYLIRNGKHLFAVLNREELLDDADEADSVSTSKKKDEVVPSRKEEVTSLNLSEYVPKPKVAEQIKSQPIEQSAPLDIVDAEIEKLSADVIDEPIALPEVEPLEIEQPAKIEEVVLPEAAPLINEQPNEQTTINEQPNEQSAPSDVLADTPLEEK